MVADILEQLDLQPGQKILEIGAGTGYDAALLAYLVGKEGHVASLDIDEDIVLEAKDNLSHVGVANVRVERADGHYGFEASAPYDRIVMSTSAPDVFPAWVKQLKDGGRLGFAVRFFTEERRYVCRLREAKRPPAELCRSKRQFYAYVRRGCEEDRGTTGPGRESVT